MRQQAADLTTRLAIVIKRCGEDQQLHTLGLVLFEQLGEEYPDTLGSIIAAEGAIANVVGMMQMNPPVKDLLPRVILEVGWSHSVWLLCRPITCFPAIQNEYRTA